MDRHIQWLRRRITASVLAQTAATFAVVAVVVAVLLMWRTSAGVLTALPAALVIAQIVAIGRVVHALRSNPITYQYVQRFVSEPFRYQVTRLTDDPHDVASKLTNFCAVATLRDSVRDPSPVFDVMQTADQTIAACISRVSGAVSLLSSLRDGRILVTDSRVVAPHQLLVVSLAKSADLHVLLEHHIRELRARTDVVALRPQRPHQVAVDLLMLEHETYRGLGPLIAPFLELEPGRRSPLRLTTRIQGDELRALADDAGPALAATPTPLAVVQEELAQVLP